jgi:hypothetical protein
MLREQGFQQQVRHFCKGGGVGRLPPYFKIPSRIHAPALAMAGHVVGFLGLQF